VLATDLPYGKHTLQLFKRTEWDKGKTLFYGFAVDNNVKLLSPPALPKRKIEFFGIRLPVDMLLKIRLLIPLLDILKIIIIVMLQ
jgi:hypothetical protein